MSMITNHTPNHVAFTAFVDRLNNTDNEEELAEGLHRTIVGKRFGPKCLQTATEILAKNRNIKERVFSIVSDNLNFTIPLVSLIVDYAKEKIGNIISKPFFTRSITDNSFNDYYINANSNALHLVFGQLLKENGYSAELKTLTGLLIDEGTVVQYELAVLVPHLPRLRKEFAAEAESQFPPTEQHKGLKRFLEDIEASVKKSPPTDEEWKHYLEDIEASVKKSDENQS